MEEFIAFKLRRDQWCAGFAIVNGKVLVDVVRIQPGAKGRLADHRTLMQGALLSLRLTHSIGRVVSPQMRLPNVRITAENRAQLVPLAINTLWAYGAMLATPFESIGQWLMAVAPQLHVTKVVFNKRTLAIKGAAQQVNNFVNEFIAEMREGVSHA